ncbi:MAG: ABC transporter ATP-binding protein [Balneolaceae bacterium]|nr:ABC transporter ATP-binding protein [Balneolaceae bacterium]MBO6545946.1 ABC transporter ATP-binding protein [Balneolaceae bacterium]MBO6647342.1 ABC transporter ATP-binding protein [Balneolaceae bacterium]
MNNLTITNLSKTYSNGVRALNNVSLEIPTGMFGLLGPNGAGKSTLMRTIATLQEADTGSITFGEIDVLKQKNEVRKITGYLPQEFGVYPKVSAEFLLDHLAVLKGIRKTKERKELVETLLHKTNLYIHRKKKLKEYSGGMKQRFGIAQALLSNPKLIIVDEPTAGLDPAERNRFHNILCELGEHTVVILSTHIVDDVKELCPNMAIINNGEVLLQDNPLRAIEQVKGNVYSKTIKKEGLEAYQQAYNVIAERLFQGRKVIHIYSDSNPGNGFVPIEADLNDVYFSQIFGDKSLSGTA